MAVWQDIREQIAGLKPTRKDLRNLGLIFCAALGLLAALSAWKGGDAWPWLAGGAVLFGAWGLLWPAGLHPLYLGWMSLAVVLGQVVSRLVLAVVFYLVVTPVGLAMRLAGKDPMDRRLGGTDSYWRARPREYEPRQTEKMY